MNTRLICTVVAALLAAGCLFAQGSQALTVNVPFGFQAGSVNLPAGEYIVDKTTPIVIRLASPDRKHTVMVLTNAVSKVAGNQDPKLIFNRYGEKYFLSQVWAAGLDGRQLLTGRAEKEMARAAIRSTQHTLVATRLK